MIKAKNVELTGDNADRGDIFTSIYAFINQHITCLRCDFWKIRRPGFSGITGEEIGEEIQRDMELKRELQDLLSSSDYLVPVGTERRATVHEATRDCDWGHMLLHQQRFRTFFRRGAPVC